MTHRDPPFPLWLPLQTCGRLSTHSLIRGLQVNVSKVWLTVSSVLLAFSFIFSVAISNTFESVVFLFVVHPFDVGDVILLVDPSNTALGAQYCQVRLNPKPHQQERTQAPTYVCRHLRMHAPRIPEDSMQHALPFKGREPVQPSDHNKNFLTERNASLRPMTQPGGDQPCCLAHIMGQHVV